MRTLTLVVAAVAIGLAVAAGPASADPTVVYFPLPANYTDSGGLDTTPDGIVYFGAAINSQDPGSASGRRSAGSIRRSRWRARPTA